MAAAIRPLGTFSSRGASRAAFPPAQRGTGGAFLRRDVRIVHGIEFCPREPLNATQQFWEAL